jgi:mono/diheme cytochrome c family protein
MAADGLRSGPGLQNAVLTLAQSAETGSLHVLHALGLAADVGGQPAWPFARRMAAWGAASRRARVATWGAALALMLLAPWPARSLILTDAQATSFHRSPTGFDAGSVMRGLALYQSHCAACHGADGNGEGPLAASLPTWPSRLGGELPWRRADGDLFGTIPSGMRDRHGTRTMPGFAGTLADADVWALIDGMKALAAGASVHAESAWVEPVRAPDALVHCSDGRPDRPLSTLRRERVRIVAGSGAGIPAADPRLVTVVLEAPGAATPASSSSDRVIRDAAAWVAYAQASGARVERFAGTQFLVDRDGWLRLRVARQDRLVQGRPGVSLDAGLPHHPRRSASRRPGRPDRRHRRGSGAQHCARARARSLNMASRRTRGDQPRFLRQPSDPS